MAKPNSNIKMRIVIVTPDLAQELLTRNTRNRKITRSNVVAIKLNLEQGRWQLNGESIKVASNGDILDGQHRLLACVETGIPFETVLMEGFDPETQITMDTGKSRGLADMLQLQGETNCTGLAAAVAVVMRADRWGVRAATISGAGSGSQGYPLTIAEQLDFFNENRWLIDLERRGAQLRAVGLPARVCALLDYVFGSLDRDDADYFFDRLLDGQNLSEGSPILTLRNWLNANRGGDAKRRANQATTLLATAMTIKAWNKYRDGEELRQLQFRVGGANPERFPEPH